jgi:hypothetical protein
MLLAFCQENFIRLLNKAAEFKPGKPSLYEDCSASFFHFVLVQILALVASFGCKALSKVMPAEPGVVITMVSGTSSAIGFLLLMYSISTGLAATIWLYRINGLFTAHIRASPPTE